MPKQEDKKIERLKISKIKGNRPQSIQVNNFFMLLTIGMVCLALLYWANYVRPAQIEYEKNQAQELKAKEEYNAQVKAYKEQRAKEIQRSKIYNSKDKNDTTH